MSSGIPDDEIRVGTPERERAIALLNESFSAGYLQLDEFEERSGSVYVARTRGELRETLHDLPSYDRLFPTAVVSPLDPGAAPTGKPLKLKADWDTTRRKGTWKVPAQIVATAELGTVDLDFTLARFLSDVVELGVQASVSTIKLRLGADQQVTYDDLAVGGWSKVKDKAGAPRRPGGPTIVLTGHLSGMSSVIIKRS